MSDTAISAELVFDDERKFVVGLWLRVVSAAVFLALLAPLTLLRIDFPFSECSPAYYGLLALVGVNALYWWVGKSRQFPISDFYAHWLVDLILISIVLYGLGGCLLPSSITAYILIVITSAVFMSKRASLIVASGAALAYGGSIFAEFLGLIDPRYDIAIPAFSPGMRLLVIVGPIFMVYLVAFITGTLGDQLNITNVLLAARNEELRIQNDQLDRMRSELDFQSKVLTHDISSPVSAAYGALGELKRELSGDSKAQDALLQIALDNLNRVGDMIEALQQAREVMESAEQLEEVDLVEIIDELRVEFEHELNEKRAELLISKPLPRIVGRRGRLVVMCRNLIVNAIRYIPGDGKGCITVGALQEVAEWRIFVRDNGPGIPAEFQKVIFEMFRKAPQKVKSPGMGLGLALVKNVAEQHHGRVWVESDGRSGSTFWIAFPVMHRMLKTDQLSDRELKEESSVDSSRFKT